MKEAMFYQRLPDDRVHCALCWLDCTIDEGKRGACGVRLNSAGKLYTLAYDKVVARQIDPIEKKPLFHFHPGSRSYSIATAGCNFRCLHCQSYAASLPAGGRAKARTADDAAVVCLDLQHLGEQVPGENVTPEQIVDAARRSGCRSIAYTYTEPTIFYELALDTARLAHAAGIGNVFVTNGYITEAPLRAIAPYLDAAAIALRSLDDSTHQRMTGAALAPVLEMIRSYHRRRIWIEVTTPVVSGYNDSDGEFRQIAEFICGLCDAIPWHVRQFYPVDRLAGLGPTPPRVLRRARKIGYEVGLKYVYEGNVPGEGGENTYCPSCHSLLVGRYGHHLLCSCVENDSCPRCQTRVPGIGMTVAGLKCGEDVRRST